MLHLRIVAPAGHTEAVLDLLRADPAAVNLAVLRAAALDPPGDLILCDLAREGANQVVSALRELGIHQHGSIALEHIDVSVSAAAEAAEARVRGYGSDAAVWEDVDARVRDESVFSAGYLALIVIASVIAAVGLVEDAPILIVGAMVVGPEFGPIAGVSLGIFKRRAARIRIALVTLVAGFAAGALAALVATALMDTTGILPDGFSPHAQPLTGFIVEPSVLSFVVALLAGVAGTLSLTQAKAGALIGVLISVTTIPAVAAIGVAIALGNWQDARAAAVQLAINVAALVIAGVLTLWVQREAWERLSGKTARTLG
jgi:uncharacterized hydrophobic protein (TIGR00271 family)